MNEVQAAQRKITSLKKALATAKNDSDRSMIERHISIWQDALDKNTVTRCNGKGKVMNA